MQAQNLKLLFAVVVALAAAVLIVTPVLLWSLDRHAVAKAAFETYETADGHVCPLLDAWQSWENPKRNQWRTSQEKLHRKSADGAGPGCYKK
jgi:hypothetical protein